MKKHHYFHITSLQILFFFVLFNDAHPEVHHDFDGLKSLRRVWIHLSPGNVFRGNISRTGYYHSMTPDKINAIKWRFKTEGAVHSSPTLTGSIVYCGSDDGNLYALDTETGSLKWKKAIPKGFFSSPAVDRCMVFIGGLDNIFYALDSKTGEEKWRLETEAIFTASAVVSDDTVYITAGDRNLYALDSLTGDVKWKFPTPSPASSPAIYSDNIFMKTGSHGLFAVKLKTGEKVWHLPMKGGGTPPAIVEGVIYIGDFDSYFYAIDTLDGTVIWRYRTGLPWYTSPAVHKGVVIFSCSGNGRKSVVFGIDAVTGEEKWEPVNFSHHIAVPSIAGDVVILPCDDGNVYGYDIITGKELWRVSTNEKNYGSPAIHEGVIFIGTVDGSILALTGDEDLTEDVQEIIKQGTLENTNLKDMYNP